MLVKGFFQFRGTACRAAAAPRTFSAFRRSNPETSFGGAVSRTGLRFLESSLIELLLIPEVVDSVPVST